MAELAMLHEATTHVFVTPNDVKRCVLDAKSVTTFI